MKIEKITTVEQDCDFSGLTLLTKEEYVKRKDRIKPIESWWWLSSPGYGSSTASIVDIDGNPRSDCVGNTYGSVRPALILESSNLKTDRLRIGDKFKFYEHEWTMISEQYALCDEPFCSMAFREYWPAKNANVYDASDIKIYLDEEWEKMKDGVKDV